MRLAGVEPNYQLTVETSAAFSSHSKGIVNDGF
jgi:hypothetical protein